MPNWILRKEREEVEIALDCQVLNCVSQPLGWDVISAFFVTEREGAF